MSNANQFRAFIRLLALDRQRATEMETILGRVQGINIDYRGIARRRLQRRIQLLGGDIARDRRALRWIDLHLTSDRGRAGELVIMVERCLAHAQGRAIAFSRALETVPILDLDRERGLDVLAAVAQDLDYSVTLATELAEISAQPSRHETLRASQRIANLAVRLLPWEERQRYRDEYLSELDALAQDENLPRRAQLAHALRLLARTPALRFALRRRAESGLVTSRPET